MTTENEKKLPAETLRDGAIKATIWKNEGEKGPWYSVEISRTYKKPDSEEFSDSNSYSGADLLKVSQLALKAYEHINELKKADAVPTS